MNYASKMMARVMAAVPKLGKNVNHILHNFYPFLPLCAHENFLNLVLQRSLLYFAAIAT
jgi:hypothetical protein